MVLTLYQECIYSAHTQTLARDRIRDDAPSVIAGGVPTLGTVLMGLESRRSYLVQRNDIRVIKVKLVTTLL